MPITRDLARGATLLALCLGCSSGSTGPKTTPSPYVGNYSGVVIGATTTGVAAVTVGQPPAATRTSTALDASSTVTVTLTTTSGSPITLTGTITGSTVTVTSSGTPPITCTLTFTSTAVTGTCSTPFGTLSLAAALEASGVVTTLYCGTQSAGSDATVAPNASLGAVVSGTQVILGIVPASGSAAVYLGTLSGNSVTLTSSSTPLQYSGTETSGGASIAGTITAGGTGAWSVASPCASGTLTLASSTVSATATAGSTTAIPKTVAITNGGSGSLGVLGVGAATYTPSSSSGWLQATLTAPTTTGATLALAIAPNGLAAGTYTAAVPISASLATATPQTVTVTLTVGSVATPTLALNPASLTFTTTVGSVPGSQTVAVTSTNGTAGGLATSTAYTGGTGWLVTSLNQTTTPATLTANIPTVPAAGTYAATVTVASTTAGVAAVQLRVALTVSAASANTGWVAIAAGVNSNVDVNCAIQQGGAAYCWAPENGGYLGDNSTAISNTLEPVYGGHVFSQLAAGYGVDCGLTTAGAAYCWGGAGHYELGDGNFAGGIDSTPQPVIGGHVFTSISGTVDGEHTCGIEASGAAFCWGANGAGELGDGNDTTYTGGPFGVVGGHLWAQIGGNNETSCGIDTSGAAWCWGLANYGSMGNGDTSTTPRVQASPTAVSGGLSFSTIAVGNGGGCGLTRATGAAYCWGNNTGGAVGDGGTEKFAPVPVAVGGGHTFQVITAIGLGYCALSNGALHCWGEVPCTTGLGDCVTTTPQPFAAGYAFTQISGGGNICGITTSTQLFCLLTETPEAPPAFPAAGSRVPPHSTPSGRMRPARIVTRGH